MNILSLKNESSQYLVGIALIAESYGRDANKVLAELVLTRTVDEAGLTSAIKKKRILNL
jgi:hypothetical protein